MASAPYQQIANSTAWLDLSDENTVLFVKVQLRLQLNDLTFDGDGDDDKRQQHPVTPSHYQPTVEALHVGTDSLKSATIELERLPKDFRGPKPDSAGVIDLTGDSNDEVSDF
jgi:hypothetical protein